MPMYYYSLAVDEGYLLLRIGSRAQPPESNCVARQPVRARPWSLTVAQKVSRASRFGSIFLGEATRACVRPHRGWKASCPPKTALESRHEAKVASVEGTVCFVSAKQAASLAKTLDEKPTFGRKIIELKCCLSSKREQQGSHPSVRQRKEKHVNPRHAFAVRLSIRGPTRSDVRARPRS